MGSVSFEKRTAEDDVQRCRPAKIVESSATPTQIAVLTHPARFKSVVATRRWGKTTCGVLRAMQKISRPKRGGLFQWIAPTYRQCQGPFRVLYNAVRGAGQVVSHDAQAMRIDVATGWRVDFRSAEVADNLRGDGPDAANIDEIAQIQDTTWDEVIRPSFADKQTDVLAIGTPKGRRGIGYRLWSRGQLGTDANYKSWRFTCYDAVFIPRAEIEEAKRTVSSRAFAQEFMAEFLETEGVVFEGVSKRRATPIPGEPVGIGADWAKDVDYTWFIAIGAISGAVLKIQRLPHRVSYLQQVDAFAARSEEFQERGFFACHDKTGVGNAVDDILLQRSDRFFNEFNLESFLFTHKTKCELVEEGVVAFEAGQLGFTSRGADDPLQLLMIKECEDFALEVGKTGKVTYCAPDGIHDDAVIALLLANRARRRVQGEAMMSSPMVTFI